MLCSLIMIDLTIRFIRSPNSKNILGIISCGINCVQTDPGVAVTASVPFNYLQFKVYPEKRIPPQHNWNTRSDFKLVNCSNNQELILNNIITDNEGIGEINPTLLNNFNSGDYRFYVSSTSHLTRKFNCYPLYTQNALIDLTLENKYLLAGEVSIRNDNYINSLDLSVLINQLFSSDYVTDLNQDGRVNALDFSIQLTNLYRNGD